MKSRNRRITFSAFTLAAAALLVVAGAMPVKSQGDIFGRNKVQYDTFSWRLLNTPHFTIHYYEGSEDAARDAARIAERAYSYISQVLQVRLEDKIPVLLYADHQDFRQTNAVSGITEGVQGVTESFKQRIVLPIMPTMEDYIHVFTHELVHRFQLEIIGAGNALNPMQWMPPLWMMEGMAEYLTSGMDPNTMIWLRDLVQREEFITLVEFETIQDQRVYRLGQGLYHFLGTRYGVDSVRRFFKETVRTRSWQEALNRVYSKTAKEVTEEWQTFLKAEHSDIAAGQEDAESIATRLIEHQGMMYNINVTPTISPDGKRIAYIANENMRDGLYVANSETGKSKKTLAYGGKTGSLEMIDFFESTMSWSDDGTILAFVSSGGSEDVIHLLDSHTGRTVTKLRYDGMSIVSAALSPDGTQIAFSGMMHGQRDLYIAATDGSPPQRLTNDIYAYLQPSWSPDGSMIAVATDRGRPTDVENLDFRGYRLALIDPGTGDVENLTTGGYHDINPVWSPEGETLAFISDRAGVPQIYLYDLENRSLRKATNLVTGISGITISSPAISWSRQTGQMAFSSYREMGWDIYTMPDPRSNSAIAVDQTVEPGADTFEPLWAGYHLGDEFMFSDEKYSARLKTDYVFGAGAYSSQVGVMGDVMVGMSDMLGNHNVVVQLGLYGALSRSNLLAAYINMTRRLNWGLSAYQMATALGGFYGSTLTTTTYTSRVYRGLSLDGYYPLSIFSRLEATVGYVGVQDDLVSTDWYGRTQVNRKLGRYKWFQVGMGHVYDSAVYFYPGPIGGARWRVSLSQTIGDLDATTVSLDFRKYITLNHRGAIAMRTMTGNIFTEGLNDVQYFRIGGPLTLHGTGYGQLIGTNLAVQNFEIRYPLLPFLPMQWDFLSAALFADVGAVWDNGSEPLWEDVGAAFDRNVLLENTAIGALGAGVRANLGWLTVFLDYSIPTNFQGDFGAGFLQFAIGQIF
ncbi:LpqB family beta-propeller domain-containing protein [Candidatus Zixiibacteriota bacterium]